MPTIPKKFGVKPFRYDYRARLTDLQTSYQAFG